MARRTTSKPAAAAVRAHRRRLKSRGMARVELNVDRRDVALVRDVATALADPTRRDAARSVLARNFGAPAAPSLKALLASAPLDDVDLTRDRDPPRETGPWVS